MNRDHPTSAVVLDLESRCAVGLADKLGIEEKQLEVAQLEDIEDMVRFSEEHEIPLGNASKPETVKRVLAEKLQKLVDKAAVKMFGAEIYAIAYGGLSGGKIKAVAVAEDVSERGLITRFLDAIDQTGPHLMIAYNGRNFDIPLLRIRCAMLGIHWPEWLPRNRREDKYDELVMWDHMDVLGEGTLDTWLRVFGLPPKTAKGSMVADMTPREAASYCADDVERERMLAQRLIPMTKHRGLME